MSTELALEGNRGLVHIANAQTNINAAIHFHNPGQSQLALTIDTPGPSIRCTKLPQAVTLPPGGSESFWFTVAIERFPSGDTALVAKLPIRKQSNAGALSQLQLFRETPPKIQCEFQAPRSAMLLESDLVYRGASIRVENSGGSFARVRLVNLEERFGGSAAAPLEVFPLSEVQVPLAIALEKEDTERIVSVAKTTLTLLIEIPDEPSNYLAKRLGQLPGEEALDAWTWCELETVEIPIPALKLHRPPRGLVRVSLPDGRREECKALALREIPMHTLKTFEFELTNDGGDKLALIEIHAGPSPSPGGLSVECLSEKRLLASGEVDFRFRLGVDADAYPPGTHVGTLIVEFENAATLDLPISFQIPTIRPRDGIIAIDFGTINSCVAHCPQAGADAESVTSPDGRSHFPSCLFFPTPTLRLFGAAAQAAMQLDARRGISCIKRALFRKPREIYPGFCPSPSELVTIFMKELLGAAILHLYHSYTSQIVLTAPVAFSAQHRQVLRDAVRAAAPEISRTPFIIDEPTAAALHYKHTHPELFAGKPINMLVFDFGGGTLDVAVLHCIGNSLPKKLALRGDAKLGGLDIDKAIALKVVDKICVHKKGLEAFDRRLVSLTREQFFRAFANKEGNHINIRSRFASLSERLKIQLAEYTRSADFTINAMDLVDHEGKVIPGYPNGFSGSISNQDFKQLMSGIIERSKRVVTNALSAANLSASDIGVVLFSGQVCNIDYLRDSIKGLFHQEMHFSTLDDPKFDLKSCVSLGAAQAAIMYGDELHASDDLSVGRIGYWKTGGHNELETMLDDRRPFGTRGDHPIVLPPGGTGVKRFAFYVDQGPKVQEEKPTPNSPDVTHLADVEVDLDQFPDEIVRVVVGLDECGALQAWANEKECAVIFPEADEDEVW